jgi:hypothetical protein
MSTPHVPVPAHLQLPPEFEDVPGYLALVDPDLRIRKSAEVGHLYVLERRCRRAPAVNTGMRDTSDMHIQARDGYIHVSGVHPSFLRKPWNIVRALREQGADLWVAGGATRFTDELEYEERWAEETKKRRRRERYREIAADAFAPMQRLNINGERSRISNVGTTPLQAATV